MRRLIILLIILAVIAVGLDVLDNIAKDRAESDMASRIEADSPGSHATVRITSFPFLGRLGASGHVSKLQADAIDVKSGDITFSRIRLVIDDLKVDRNDLFHGKVKPLSIAQGRVLAVVSQASVDSLVHLPLKLQAGRVSVAGISVPVHLTVSGGGISFSVAGHSLSIKIPVLDVLPCVGAAQVVKGAVHVSCRFRKLPPLLSDTTFGA